MQTWSLSTDHQQLVLAAGQDQLPQVVYWGAVLPASQDLSQLAVAAICDVTGGMLDANPAVSICPEATQNFPGQTGLALSDASGMSLYPALRFDHADATDTRLTVHYRDAALGLRYWAEFEADTLTGMITCQAGVDTDQPIWLHWLAAPVMPAPQHADHMLDFSGRWIGEFQMNQVPWTPGAHLRDNRTGRTGHEHFPAVLLPLSGTTNTQGEVYGLHYGWSGGHRMVAEELADGRRHVQFGHAWGSENLAGTAFKTAPLYLTYSDRGLNGCAVTYQRHLRDRILTMPHPDRPRPVHYNCWEAIYFDHKLDELTAIAERASALGAERFVLDDGWFGLRDDDTTSLGDWTIDPRKYPEGLGPLIDHIHGLGMSFGIWFEPEMVNEDSSLYRAHPEWLLGSPEQIRGRQQLVLNMALPEVRAYLYDHMAAVLSAYDVDYIKWDHNRVLPEARADQARGYYALLEQLRRDFPKTEIESCASGGGRIDFGVLQHTQRVWLSDSNDALERLQIQHNAALFLPMVVTGSHVGPRTCHTSGRVIDIRMRAWVAAQRHLGFEMDPRELTDDEEAVLKEVTTWWKANRDWMALADILRLDAADPAVTSELQLAQDGSRFVVFSGRSESSRQILSRPVRLTGLEPDALYQITLLNRADAPGLSRGAPALKSEDLTLSGQYLMTQGLTLPWTFPQTMWVLEGTKVQ
ncbi:MAG: alpha-galactosidase [Thalassovita sp.]